MMSSALFLCISIVLVAQTTSCTTKDKLVRDLTSDYLTVVDPGHSKLQFGLAFQCAIYDKRTGLVSSRVLEALKWTDERLKWDPTKYDGINQLRLPTKLLWVPDVKLYNPYLESETRDETMAVVYSDGSVLWMPTANYVTRCTPSGESSANCYFKIGSWTYNRELVELVLLDTGYNNDFYTDTCPFTVNNTIAKVENKEYPCCPGEQYPSYELTLDVTPRA